MTESRLDRQIMYLGSENQREIEKNKVVLVGGGNDAMLKDTLAQHVLIGSRDIKIVTDGVVDENEHWFGIKLDDGLRAYALEKVIKKHFEDRVNIKVAATHAESVYADYFFQNSDVIFDCSNNSKSKGICFRNSGERMVHSMSCTPYGAGYKRVLTREKKEFDMDSYFEIFHGEEQSPIMSMLVSGFAMQNYLMSFKESGKNVYEDTFWYRLDSADPFQKPDMDNKITIEKEDIEKIKAQIIGLGAVGTAGIEVLARMGLKDAVLNDFDVIEKANRHAQAPYLFLDDDMIMKVSQKCHVSANRLNRSYGSNFIPDNSRFDFESRIAPDIDVVFSYVDRIFPRALIDNYCYNNEINQIYGATSADAGSAALSIPFDVYGDPYPSMNQFFLLDDQVKQELEFEREELQRVGCGRQHFPSLVPVNFMIGSLSAHLLPFLVRPDKYGYPNRQTRKYNVIEEEKMFLTDYEQSLGEKDYSRFDKLKKMHDDILGGFK